MHKGVDHAVSNLQMLKDANNLLIKRIVIEL